MKACLIFLYCAPLGYDPTRLTGRLNIQQASNHAAKVAPDLAKPPRSIPGRKRRAIFRVGVAEGEWPILRPIALSVVEPRPDEPRKTPPRIGVDRKADRTGSIGDCVSVGGAKLQLYGRSRRTRIGSAWKKTGLVVLSTVGYLSDCNVSSTVQDHLRRTSRTVSIGSATKKLEAEWEI